MVLFHSCNDSFVKPIRILWNIKFASVTHSSTAVTIKSGYHLNNSNITLLIYEGSRVWGGKLHQCNYSNCQSVNSGKWEFYDCLDWFLLIWLTAAVRSTSFLLLRMKQASASSILRIDRQTSRKKDRHTDRQVHRLVIVERPKLWREARQGWVLLPRDIGWKGLQPHENNLILERSHNTTWGAGSIHCEDNYNGKWLQENLSAQQGWGFQQNYLAGWYHLVDISVWNCHAV